MWFLEYVARENEVRVIRFPLCKESEESVESNNEIKRAKMLNNSVVKWYPHSLIHSIMVVVFRWGLNFLFQLGDW